MTEKMIRTPKEWDETCRECQGTGKVHKREHFSLLTPDEQAKLFGPDRAPTVFDTKHDVPANAVVCWAGAGASIFEACTEGVTLARAFGRPVAFEFNETVVVCSSDADPEDVAKRWWKRAYGKTYEQSAADR
jgi:hypothetical protein